MTDKDFTKIATNLLLGVKDLAEWGIEGGHTTADQLRLTVEARQAKAKELVNGGLSHRQVGRLLGVSHQTIGRDVVPDGPRCGPKQTTANVEDDIEVNEDRRQEINVFISESTRFLQQFVSQFEDWVESGPVLSGDARASLLRAMYLGADEYKRMADQIKQLGAT